MSTIKTDRVDFEKLLNGLYPVNQAPAAGNAQGDSSAQGVVPAAATPGAVVDGASATQMMNEPLFVFEYESERKGIRKKCRKTILGIVNHIIPKDMIDDEYVQDKIEQDIETLTELYMQVRLNTVMQRANVEMTARGNYTARSTEVFGQLTDKIQSINKQIFETEQRIRKTYLDLKFEIRDKQGEDFSSGVGPDRMIGGPASDGGILVGSSKSMIQGAMDIKKQIFMEALKAKEAKATVIEND